MSIYLDDRRFSDNVFRSFVLPHIYPEIGWAEHVVKSSDLEYHDLNNGIDAFALDVAQNSVISLQYRFRDVKYSAYTDVTLRYRRDQNLDVRQHPSEFFKIKANFLLYGTSNLPKASNTTHTLARWAILNLDILMDLIGQERIIVSSTLNANRCTVDKGRLLCPVNHNRDGSSTFVPFDISLLNKLFGNTVVPFLHGNW